MAKINVKGMRHEIKILITYADYVDLSNKLSMVCSKDEFTTDEGDYFIRSLYFDDVYNSSYVEKVGGSDNRKKYRIRIYNYSDSVIKLECKEKLGSRIKKTSCRITREIYDDIMVGKYESLLTIDHPLAKEYYALMRGILLSPAIIVDYDREAFVHPLSNTRITFDKNLHAGITSFDIFDENLTTMPVYPNGSIILEVKYDHFLPAHLATMISTVIGAKMSLSKFCLCRDRLTEINLTALCNKTSGNNFN